MADENPNQTEEAPPPQAVVIQMVMSAWVSKALSEMGETAGARRQVSRPQRDGVHSGKERTRGSSGFLVGGTGRGAASWVTGGRSVDRSSASRARLTLVLETRVPSCYPLSLV